MRFYCHHNLWFSAARRIVAWAWLPPPPTYVFGLGEQIAFQSIEFAVIALKSRYTKGRVTCGLKKYYTYASCTSSESLCCCVCGHPLRESATFHWLANAPDKRFVLQMEICRVCQKHYFKYFRYIIYVYIEIERGGSPPSFFVLKIRCRQRSTWRGSWLIYDVVDK